jgi:hypothetical protein
MAADGHPSFQVSVEICSEGRPVAHHKHEKQ